MRGPGASQLRGVRLLVCAKGGAFGFKSAGGGSGSCKRPGRFIWDEECDAVAQPQDGAGAPAQVRRLGRCCGTDIARVRGFGWRAGGYEEDEGERIAPHRIPGSWCRSIVDEVRQF